MSRREAVRAEIQIVVHGTDHVTAGQIATQAAGTTGAVAISLGRFPKAHPSVDPNEDAAALAIGGGRFVAAVIDGHLGYPAAAATAAAIAEEVGLLLATPPATIASAMQTVLAIAEDRIASALLAAEPELASSRAAVTLAVGHEGGLCVATMGDTVALLVTRRRMRRFRAEKRYLGPQHGPVSVHCRRWPRGAERLVLASDGFSDYAPVRDTPSILAQAGDTQAAAHALVESALDGGAGDNVTVAVIDLSGYA